MHKKDLMSSWNKYGILTVRYILCNFFSFWCQCKQPDFRENRKHFPVFLPLIILPISALTYGFGTVYRSHNWLTATASPLPDSKHSTFHAQKCITHVKEKLALFAPMCRNELANDKNWNNLKRKIQLAAMHACWENLLAFSPPLPFPLFSPHSILLAKVFSKVPRWTKWPRGGLSPAGARLPFLLFVWEVFTTLASLHQGWRVNPM